MLTCSLGCGGGEKNLCLVPVLGEFIAVVETAGFQDEPALALLLSLTDAVARWEK